MTYEPATDPYAYRCTPPKYIHVKTPCQQSAELADKFKNLKEAYKDYEGIDDDSWVELMKDLLPKDFLELKLVKDAYAKPNDQEEE